MLKNQRGSCDAKCAHVKIGQSRMLRDHFPTPKNGFMGDLKMTTPNPKPQLRRTTSCCRSSSRHSWSRTSTGDRLAYACGRSLRAWGCSLAYAHGAAAYAHGIRQSVARLAQDLPPRAAAAAPAAVPHSRDLALVGVRIPNPYPSPSPSPSP